MAPLTSLVAHVDPPTMIAAAVLVLAALLLIRIGKALLLAAIFGGMTGAISLGQGSSPTTAAIHAAIGFGVAVVTQLFIGFTKSLLLWLLVTALGGGALFVLGFAK